MPAFLVTIIKLLIQYGGPIALGWLKKQLESSYPEWAQMIEDLINNLLNPLKSNSASRKEAMETHKALCTGSFCPPSLKDDK